MKFLAERPDKAVLFKGSVIKFNHGEIETDDKELIEVLSKAQGVKAEKQVSTSKK